MNIKISPCPNDTFTFHAMLHGLVDCEGIDFRAEFYDIDQLNRIAESDASQVDVIKVSYAALESLCGQYNLLDSGSALGYGNGPLLVSRHKIYPDELHDAVVAIPGEQTTAAKLLTTIYPQAIRRRVYLFSDIAEAIAEGEVDAGVLIHEGRFTYQAHGLSLIADLGQQWELLTSLPIPLGGIVINKSVDPKLAASVSRIIRRSIEFAMQNPLASADFVKSHARELDEEVRRKHITFFVNEFSLTLGEKGRQAIARLLGDDVYGRLTVV